MKYTFNYLFKKRLKTHNLLFKILITRMILRKRTEQTLRFIGLLYAMASGDMVKGQKKRMGSRAW